MAYKRGGVYWYDFWFQGERYVGSTKLKNKIKAELAESKLRTDLAMGLFGLAPTQAAPMTKAFLEGEFLAAIRNRSRDKPRTIAYYAEKVRRLLEWNTLATARLNQIDEKLLEHYVQWRSVQPRRSHGKGVVSVGSINGELRALRHALHLAKEWKLIHDLPKIRMLAGASAREFVVSGDLENQYLAAAEYPLREAAIVLLDCGLRPDELVRLRKADVSFTGGYLRVTSGKTKNAARVVQLSRRTKPVIQLMFDFWPDSEWVFAGQRKGKHLTVWALDNLHRELRSRLKLPKAFVIYSFRHTFGTRLGESGADPFAIMRLMGHSSVKVSERYVHPTPEHLDRAMRRKELYDLAIRDGEMDTAPAEVPQGSLRDR
jgi:integrase